MADAASVKHAWAPGYAWCRQTDGFETRLNFVPRVFERNASEEFEASVHFYTGHPIASKRFRLPSFRGDRELRVPLKDVLGRVGLDSFDGLIEIHGYHPSKAPDPHASKFLEVWVDVASKDGRFYISYPAVPNRGQSFRIVTGQYQVWPGVLIQGPMTSSVVLLNANRKPVPFRLTVFNAAGESLESPEMEAPYRSVTVHGLEERVPGCRALLAKTNGIGSLRIFFRFKLNAYVMISNAEQGTVTSFDHLSPYFR
jgi:hypothetical protein